MVGLDYVINLIDKNFTSGMASAKKNTQGLDSAVQKTTKDTQKLEGASKQGFGGMVKWAKRAAVATGLVFGIGQAMAFGNEVTNVTAQMEGYTNAIEFASGADGAKNLQFLDNTVKKLNLDMASSYSGFQSISGAMKGTVLEGQATRDIFEGVGMAATVMNLKSDQVQGAFLAIGQIASKGKLQAEELRGQLGERIPGAFAIASKAMGVTQVEMNKLLDGGKIYAEDFLPKFARELKKTFQDGLPAAANSLQAAINKKNNALFSFKKTVGKTMRPAIIEIMNLKTQLFAFMEELIPKLRPVWDSIMSIGDALKPLTDRFMQAGVEMGGTQGILDGLKTAIDAVAIVVEILANGIGFLWDNFGPLIKVMGIAVALQWVWNAAMAANPIGLVILGVAALVGGIMYAYEKVGWFRGAISATWESLKGFAGVIKDLVINRIKDMISGITGLGTAIMHFFNGDWKEAVNAGKEAARDLIGIDTAKQAAAGLKEVGRIAGDAYNKGVSEAEANSLSKTNPLGGTKKDTANSKVFGDTTETDDKVTGNETNKNKLSGAVSGSGGGGAGKNITFKIESLVKQLIIQPQTLKEGAQDIEKQVKDIFVRLIRDVELQTN